MSTVGRLGVSDSAASAARNSASGSADAHGSFTQLALSFALVVPAYRYRDGVGLWRCNNCLREVPCGCSEVEKP